MAHLTNNELYDMQYDVLWENTANNPQLTASNISSRNKALNTTNKRVIGAINEVQKSSNSVDASLEKMASDYNRVIGNFGNDSTLEEKLNEIDSNIILALYKLYQENKELKITIESLKLRLDTIEGEEASKSNYEYAEDTLIYSGSNTFLLSHQNILTSNFELLINGIEYKMDSDFTLDAERGILTWLGNDVNNGFTLDTDFEIIVQYWYKK